MKAEYIEIANKTCRTNGAVGKNAIVPRVIRNSYSTRGKVLDFGAGTHMAHTLTLRGEGFDVDAYEFGSNVTDGHVRDICPIYSVVYMSNVLNVQSDINMLVSTIRLAKGGLVEGGDLVANYPQSPRKGGFSNKEMREVLEGEFEVVERLDGNVFVCSHAK